MMKCGNVKKLLSDYLDEALPTAVDAEVASHLSRCPLCSRELDKLSKLKEELASLGGASAPWDLWPGVQRQVQMAALRPGWLATLRGLARKPLIAVPALGVLATAIGLSIAPLVRPSQTPTARADAEFYSEYVRAYSQFRSQQPLADVDAVTAAAELADDAIVGDAP